MGIMIKGMVLTNFSYRMLADDASGTLVHFVKVILFIYSFFYAIMIDALGHRFMGMFS